ncbi:ROK family glucokinase [Geomicrobium sp. JCM 19055]|uniref:ROK family glucokinase n=1 Tax=Geomicrobium sp. JCM 19055 TaxID=1460649 RepID=UPI00045ED5B7|nr:ROK family glucokinase [Geomicrobium sp. JCM 19055]GAK01775.1 glucokinase [Geomicrobium sp. JCM 19055]
MNVVIGVDIGASTIKLGAFTTLGQLQYKWSIKTNVANNGESIASDIAMSIKRQMRPSDKLLSIGIGVPGFVPAKRGVVHGAVNVGWKEYNLKARIERLLDVSAFVNNDANLAALGEYWQGAGQQNETLLLVTLGTGVGGGIIHRGEIINGPNGTGGEIGHVTIKPGGRLCACNRRGCLEEYIGTKGFANTLHDKLSEKRNVTTELEWGDSVESIVQAAKSGDYVALEIIEECTYYLALALANAVTLINPNKVLIGGGISAARDSLFQPLREHFSRFALLETDPKTLIVPAKLGNEAGIYGAAKLALDRHSAEINHLRGE